MATRKTKNGKAGVIAEDMPKLDPDTETELDWACAARFNKIIWSKWPKSVKSMFGLADWLRSKGYVVRWRMPMAHDAMNTTKWLMDLMIGEKETVHELFHLESLPKDGEARKQAIGELRLAQRSRLVCTSCIKESNGESFMFALLRVVGGTNCIVFFTYQ